jgi:PIN domain nuclease of toxin-antitoxin system
MTGPRLLLDTCAAMYLMANEWMSDAARKALAAASASRAPLYVSPFTAWEVGAMEGKDRFRSSLTPQRWWSTLVSAPGIELCPLSPEILLQSWSLPGKLNKDPADRIIAATAREHGFTVLTRDRALLAYGEEGHIRALAC